MYLPEMHLGILQQEGGFPILQIKTKSKRFPTKLFPLPQTLVLYILYHALQIYTLGLDRTETRGVTFQSIFPPLFCDRMNISLPFIYPIFEPLAFGFVVPDINGKIICTRKNPKHMMCAKQFHCFDMIKMHNYDSFSSIRVIPPRQAIAF